MTLLGGMLALAAARSAAPRPRFQRRHDDRRRLLRPDPGGDQPRRRRARSVPIPCWPWWPIGFLGYMILDRTSRRMATRARAPRPVAARRRRGRRASRSTAFSTDSRSASPSTSRTSVGIIVAAAVLVHDFSDGINTVGIVLGKQGGVRSAFRLAAGRRGGAGDRRRLDPAAAILHGNLLGYGLALFAGFFIYISASDLLPESYHDHPTGLTTVDDDPRHRGRLRGRPPRRGVNDVRGHSGAVRGSGMTKREFWIWARREISPRHLLHQG